MMTLRDPYVNMLRTTVAAFAAGVAGADAVTVLAVRRRHRRARRARPPGRPQHPGAAARGVPRRRGHRSGRRLLVRRVAHRFARPGGLGRIPGHRGGRRRAGGARRRGDRARDRFQPARNATTSWPSARTPITGVSEFPQPDEKPLRREFAPPTAGRRAARASAGPSATRRCASAPTTSPSSHEHPPTVLLVPLGSARAAAARLTFAGDLLRPAGIEGAVLEPAGDGASDEVLAKALEAAPRPSPACAEPTTPTRPRPPTSPTRCAAAAPPR